MFNDTLQHYLEQDNTAKVVVIVLAIGLIVSVFQLIQIGVIPKQQPQETKAAAPVAYQAFVPSPLFGQSPAGVLEQTRLNLILKGTFAASHSTVGSAVIGSPDKGDHIYVVGDKVEGATITDIQPDYVVFDYQGKKEILRMPEGKRLTTP